MFMSFHPENQPVVKSCSGRNVIILGEAKIFVAVSIDNAVSVVACLHRWDILCGGLRSWKRKRKPTPFSCMADEILCSVIWGGSDVVTVLKPHRV